MYNNDDIQDMITKAKKDMDSFYKAIDSYGISNSDKNAIKSVINSGWYEDFDRYDSAVCEHFIRIYENWRHKQ